eukprot:jgi/Psemu1/304348/fgenesh1_kg.147_\
MVPTPYNGVQFMGTTAYTMLLSFVSVPIRLEVPPREIWVTMSAAQIMSPLPVKQCNNANIRGY